MLLRINLRLFDGGEKTEKATPKKKKDARKKGQVLKSREITSSAMLLFSMLALKFMGKYIFESMKEALVFFIEVFFENNSNISDSLEGYKIFLYMAYFVIKGSVVVVAANFAVAFIANYAQVGNLFTLEVLNMKLDRLNPVEGLKKMFSAKSLFEFLKSFMKIALVGLVGYFYIKGKLPVLMKVLELDKYQYSLILVDILIDLGLRLAVILFVLAVIDYFYQRYEYEKNLKMSKQEIKDEYKQVEGDPQVKSKIKEKQRQMAMNRMMQELPKADVVITNPTHFAVALKYNPEEDEVPYVIAKGKNMVALKIREKAKEESIPIVENKPLARQLHASLEIGDGIPGDLYEAVAEVLAYIYSKKTN